MRKIRKNVIYIWRGHNILADKKIKKKFEVRQPAAGGARWGGWGYTGVQ